LGGVGIAPEKFNIFPIVRGAARFAAEVSSTQSPQNGPDTCIRCFEEKRILLHFEPEIVSTSGPTIMQIEHERIDHIPTQKSGFD